MDGRQSAKEIEPTQTKKAHFLSASRNLAQPLRCLHRAGTVLFVSCESVISTHSVVQVRWQIEEEGHTERMVQEQSTQPPCVWHTWLLRAQCAAVVERHRGSCST